MAGRFELPLQTPPTYIHPPKINSPFPNKSKSITIRPMTLSDLNPDALAELEAKLTRDLEMVRRVHAAIRFASHSAP